MEDQQPPLTTTAATAMSSSTSCWSNIVKTTQPPKPQPETLTPAQVLAQSCKNSKGIAVAVIDANAVIQGGNNNLHSMADKFVTVPEVLAEIRDPVSRHRLNLIPFQIDSMEPTPDALNKVNKFARATGDLQTLSDVDIKLIALTYTLEAQFHGISHLRNVPPPVQMVNVKRLPEKDMPGWGSNVPNLDEWEALDKEFGNGGNMTSRILPLKDLSLNVIGSETQSVDGFEMQSVNGSENLEDVVDGDRRPKKYLPKKKVINLEGKVIAEGVDASQGQVDDEDGEFEPAVGRSTRRRFLRRKARREQYEALAEKDYKEDLQKSADNNGNEDISESLQKIRLEEEVNNIEDDIPELIDDLNNMTVEEHEVEEMDSEGINNLEIASETNESLDSSFVDDESSEQSWMLRSLSESSVACVTADFAMQNVILQMGLRLLAPGGMQIRELHRWILKCHACYTVTADIGRIFCPKCGNGGTLRKVAATVGENGVVLASRKPRITLRGTKFSLPMPQGGREAITKNLVLREDQLPKKFLNPKKKPTKKTDDIFSGDGMFTHHTDKRAPLQPPVRKALAVFSGRRNPNDNHFSHAKH
ncbi:hypothetical protein ACFE04_013844 [Oxalis oulophora]